MNQACGVPDSEKYDYLSQLHFKELREDDV